jgi:hypothetical protein
MEDRYVASLWLWYETAGWATTLPTRLEAFYKRPGQAFEAKIRPIVEVTMSVDRRIEVKNLRTVIVIVSCGFFANSNN